MGQTQAVDFDNNDRDPAEWAEAQIIYFHKGISAGPTLLTDEMGVVLEERRYEPFGQPLADDVGSMPDHKLEPHGWVNKPYDHQTGFSYHGARWLSPQIARWLTPDPPVKGPDPKFMGQPWAMHPYQYVKQNPIVYWDPDGRQDDSSEMSSADWLSTEVGQMVFSHGSTESRAVDSTVTMTLDDPRITSGIWEPGRSEILDYMLNMGLSKGITVELVGDDVIAPNRSAGEYDTERNVIMINKGEFDRWASDETRDVIQLSKTLICEIFHGFANFLKRSRM